MRRAVEAGRLRYAHVDESHRGHMGTGTVDFDTFCGILRDVEYAGPVVFESFSSVVVHPTLSNQLAVCRNLWDDGADLARHATSSSPSGCATDRDG